MIDHHNKIKKSEQDIISLLILSPDSIYFFIENIKPRDFKDKRNAIIYRAIQYLFFQKESVDLISIASVLKASNKLEECGGPIYLGELVTNFSKKIEKSI